MNNITFHMVGDAFKWAIPGANIKLFDTGHFALEVHRVEIASDTFCSIKKNSVSLQPGLFDL